MYVELLHEEAENDVILQNRSAEVAFANQSDLPPIVVHSIGVISQLRMEFANY